MALVNLKQIKKIINYLWISVVLFILIYLFLHPTAFSAENLSVFLQKFGHWVWLVYIIISFLRGIFLFPSTPFVFAGAILFPEKLILVGIVSILGILFSATLLYYFSDAIGFGDYLSKKYPKKIEKARIQLNKPQGKWLVAAWAWFPFVPTDIICYVAGLVRMRFRIMITGIFLGETILISLYLYLGKDILSVL
ncbi:MAG: TVP38/TMEM64 family protein [Aureispira sp.]|nr:TVP38/TMEM64 family protein [Aureispira sp.]